MAEPISISIIATLILTTAGEVAVDKAKEELGKVAGDWIKDKLGLQKANKDVCPSSAAPRKQYYMQLVYFLTLIR